MRDFIIWFAVFIPSETMDDDEYVTIMLPMKVFRKLQLFKKEILRLEGRRLSDSDAISEAVNFALAYRISQRRSRKTINFLDCAGMIKGGPRTNSSNAKELDEILYGNMDPND